MLGHQHALSGAAVGLVAAPALDVAYGLSPLEQTLTVMVTIGASMVPDLDQPGSTISRTYGFLTNGAARVLAKVAGGHRNGTHSLLGVAAFTGLAYAATEHAGALQYVVLWVLLGVAARAAGLTLRAHHTITALVHALVMGVFTLLVIASPADLTVPLVAGMLLGTAAHIAGDMLTPQGCPLLWPVSRARHGVGLVTTGSRWSSPLVTGALSALVLVAALAVTPLGPTLLA